MTAAPAPKGTGTITPSQGSAHSRIMGVGGYRPERVVMNAEIVDETSCARFTLHQTGMLRHD